MPMHYKFGKLPPISLIAGLVNEENTITEGFQQAYGPGEASCIEDEVPLGYMPDDEQIWGRVE